MSYPHTNKDHKSQWGHTEGILWHKLLAQPLPTAADTALNIRSAANGATFRRSSLFLRALRSPANLWKGRCYVFVMLLHLFIDIFLVILPFLIRGMWMALPSSRKRYIRALTWKEESDLFIFVFLYSFISVSSFRSFFEIGKCTNSSF